MAQTATIDSAAAGVESALTDRILRAAFVVFVDHGFSAATTDMIQARSGVAKSTIYRYFPSKEILFSTAVELCTLDFLFTIRDIDLDYADIPSFLTRFSANFLRKLFSKEGVDVTRLLIAESKRFPHLGRLFYRTGPKRVADVVETHLWQAHLRGEIKLRNATVAAEHFMSMIRGDNHLRALLGERAPSELQLARYAADTVDAFLEAYRA